METYNSPLKEISGAEGERCHYPLRFDSYFGCNHNCVYCYSKDINKRWGNLDDFSLGIKKASIDDLRTRLTNILLHDNKKTKKFAPYLKNKIPLRIGANTDPFQPCEKDEKITFELIKLLNEFDYPYIIVTKSDLIASNEYIDILRPDLAYIQISITSLNDELSMKLEPNAPLPQARIAALEKLSNNGFTVAARISPIIPIYEDGYFSKNHSKPSAVCNFFSFDLIHQVCKVKPTTVIAEFLRISKSMSSPLQSLGIPINQLYTQNFRKSYQNFSLAEKRIYLQNIKDICDSYNVQFTVCDDENFEDLSPFWNNPCDCCNGCNNIVSFRTKAFLQEPPVNEQISFFDSKN